jgi:hypothetical protein
MAQAFAKQADTTPFVSVPNEIALDEMNAPVAALRGLEKKMALASMKMDFSEPDNAPEDLLSRVIWHSVKGPDTPYPANQHDACEPVLRKAGAGLLH